MGFKIYCANKENGKKCNKEMEPSLDTSTNIVYCECGKELEDQDAITIFARRQMRTLRQTNNYTSIKEKVKQSNEFLERIHNTQKEAAKKANPVNRPRFTTDEDVEKFGNDTSEVVLAQNINKSLESQPKPEPRTERSVFKNPSKKKAAVVKGIQEGTDLNNTK